jgi:hypothetical protein
LSSSSGKTYALFASLVLQIYEKGFIRKSILAKKMKKLFSLSSALKLLFCSPHGKTCVYSQSISFFFAHHSGFNSFFHSVSSVFSHRQCFSLLQRLISEKKVEDFFAKQVGSC